jgi:outer membrane receptor for ferrienterochelin and colicin
MYLKQFICSLFVLSSLLGASQTVTGKVTDAATNEPLAGAAVVWMGTNIGSITDGSGKFETTRPAQSSSLIFSYVGYKSDTVPYTQQQVINHKMNLSATGPTVLIEGDVPATHITGRNPQLFQVLGEKELCKAACCNLSESFETNASIDASFADAITGTRQIKMLGLDGKYTQMMFDNMPAVRGLASTYGLTYVPGTWVKNIYIAKGIGSVLGGFESITGQINVAYKNPENSEHLAINGYGGSGGRMELNVIWKPAAPKEQEAQESKHKIRLSPVLLAHAAMSQLRTDHNGDGFLDNPLFNNIILRNEWHLKTNGGLGGQYAAAYTHINNVSGKLNYDPLDEIRSQLWGVNVTTDRYDVTAKTGYVFSEKNWKSFGSQLSGSIHNQTGNYGYRQYSGKQISARANLLFATHIKNDSHKITSGASYLYDDYTERLFFNEFPPISLNSLSLNKTEKVAGVFSEYTWNMKEKLVAIAGVRLDYHNIYKLLFTPRLHVRYSITDLTSIKFLAGRGYRTPSLLMDNVGILASNRNIFLQGNNANGLFGMDIESAWNSGILFTHKFKLNHREAVISADVFNTQFTHQVVMDIESASIVRFYNLNGRSYSNSAQIEMQWSPIKRLEWRLAYRWLDAKTQYDSLLLERPLLNKHRAFTNVAYATKEKNNGAHWRFDATLSWVSKKRLPAAGNHTDHSMPHSSSYSDPFFQLNAQVTYAFKKGMELYVGGENLTNFVIHDAIILSENPQSEYFDGSLVWGPVFGRMGYVGFRWYLK